MGVSVTAATAALNYNDTILLNPAVPLARLATPFATSVSECRGVWLPGVVFTQPHVNEHSRQQNHLFDGVSIAGLVYLVGLDQTDEEAVSVEDSECTRQSSNW